MTKLPPGVFRNQWTARPSGEQRFGNTYRAQASVNGRQRYLGTYKTIEEAHAAVIAANQANARWHAEKREERRKVQEELRCKRVSARSASLYEELFT